MKTGVLSLAFVFLVGCSSTQTQTERFAGRTPGLEGAVAEWVWADQLKRKWTARWHHNSTAFRAVRGKVTVEREESITQARVGMRVRAGTTITVAEDSGADLYLGENGAVLRMTGGSKVRLVRLDLWREKQATIVDTMIEIEKGHVFGYVKPLSPESSFLLKTPGGVIRIRGMEFATKADGSSNVAHGMAIGEKPGNNYVMASFDKHSNHQIMMR